MFKFLWPYQRTCKEAFRMADVFNVISFTTAAGIESYCKENGAMGPHWKN